MIKRVLNKIPYIKDETAENIKGQSLKVVIRDSSSLATPKENETTDKSFKELVLNKAPSEENSSISAQLFHYDLDRKLSDFSEVCYECFIKPGVTELDKLPDEKKIKFTVSENQEEEN